MTLEIDPLTLKAKFFRRFADPTRLSIIECLRRGEKAVGEIVSETRQAQPNVSNHLGCLRDCGLVKTRRDGKNVLYSLSNGKIKTFLLETDRLLSVVYEEIYRCTRYKE